MNDGNDMMTNTLNTTNIHSFFLLLILLKVLPFVDGGGDE